MDSLTREPPGKPRILLTGLPFHHLIDEETEATVKLLACNSRLGQAAAGDLGFGSSLKDYGACGPFTLFL